jgi:hypothetical protein
MKTRLVIHGKVTVRKIIVDSKVTVLDNQSRTRKLLFY